MTDPTDRDIPGTEESKESPTRSRSRSRSSASTSRTRTRRRSTDAAPADRDTASESPAAAEAPTKDRAEDAPGRGSEDQSGGQATSAGAEGDRTDAADGDDASRSRSRGGRGRKGGRRSPSAADRDAADAPDDAGAKRDAGAKGDGAKGGGARGDDLAKGDADVAGDGAGAAADARQDRDPSSDGEDDGESGGSGRRRRRRGRRGRGGRGRGRGGNGGAGAEAEAGKGTSGADDAASADDARDDGAGGKKRGKAAGERSDRGDGASKDDAGNGGGTDDESVEAAMAKGGTRLAAKRSRRSNGGNGSRGGNGRGRSQRPGGVPEEVRRAILEGPPRTMLVTARKDRTQIAVLEDRTVVEHYVTRKEDVTYVGNIYMARVQNVLPGMEAAFLDIGKGRNGVLYAGEVLYDELDLEEGDEERIENVLKPGQKVLVQVTKDPMGSKGPRLTMHLSLAGRYMVLAPNSDLFGISRKLTDRERDRLRKVVKKVKPTEHGVIVRTAAEGATDEQITADLERLLAKWQRVEEAADKAKALTAVYEEPPLVVKVIRDNFGPEFERCIVDDEDLYHQVRDYLDEVAPELLDKVELYGAPTTDARAKAAGAPSADGASAADDAEAEVAPGRGDAEAAGDGKAGEGQADDQSAGDGGPTADDEARPAAGTIDLEAARERRKDLPALFEAYDVSDQLRKAMGKKVWLPSGGYLIIETTEAMKVIDVNTGKFTGGSDTNLEEVVLKTNLEAADEIVRQLRLRDMGGIIVIDFIDMLLKSNQEQVVRRLKRELLRDRTKTRVSDVSKLGLVQMTRKNVSQGLVESFSHTCKECEGRGLVSELE